MRGAAMGLTSAAGGFVFLLLTATVVQGLNGWEVKCNPPQICASKGSTAEIHCTYRYPPTVTNVTNKFWFTKLKTNGDYVNLRTDPEYSGRVKYDCDQNSCTLRITDVTDRDQANYKFRFITDQPDGKYTGLPGVTLSVADLQVQVNSLEVQKPLSWAEMTCRSSCRLPGHLHYAWFKNEWKIREDASDSYSDYVGAADVYSCAVDGYEASRSPPVYAPRLPSVSVNPSTDFMVGSTVTLTCSSDARPAAKYSWYKENQTVLINNPQLVLWSIQSSDSGEFYCAAENKLGRKQSEHISVDAKYAPKLPSVSVSPPGEIVEGSSVTLTCSSDANPAANYTWYKESLKMRQGPEGSYNFTSISSKDGGHYYCISSNQYGNKISSPLFIDVKYAPKLPSVSVSPSGEIVEGRSVTLKCLSDANPPANYTWYNEHQKLLQGQTRSQHFSSISSKDRGQYYCKSENKYGHIMSSPLLIDVQYAPRLLSVSLSPSGKIVDGSSVTLTCSSDANPAASYTWYKENEDSPKASGEIFTITDVRAEHSGNYCCEAQNKRGHSYTTLHVTVVAGPRKAWTSAVIGTTPAVFLAIIWLSVYLLISVCPVRQRRRLTFTMPLSTSPRTSPILCTATSDQLDPADTRTKKSLSTLLSNLTVPALPREQEGQKVGRIQLHCTVQSTELLNAKGISSLSVSSFFLFQP
ncbi:B-cell receptor CD22-like isoform X2 [Chelmon rostratus]|uniref:B-cell receptor CD22-like isoform X2 n=1 Tax=Chelmon rostratus TaxID=109905 RepID=UPI001BEB3519|nr:B-cell receptor CD22-like isoform X2 [Chelmon rostratus]